MKLSAELADALRLASALDLSRLVNIFKLEISYLISRLIRRPIHCGLPAAISVEPTAMCNLKCPECPTGRKELSRPSGIVSPEFLQSIVSQLSTSVVYLNLYFQGEPYLHPEFSRLVACAHKAGIYTSTSTNGHFLTEANILATIGSGLDRLIVSLDGTDQETYEKYRAGGDFRKVIDGIRRMVELKKELRSRTPFLILQFIVFRSNEHQLPGIRKLAGELGVDRLEIKTAQLNDFREGHPLMPLNPRFSRYRRTPGGHYILKHPLRNRCHRMWTGCVITWDGLVVPCCFDKDAGHVLGDLKLAGFRDIWEGKACRDFRTSLMTRRSSIDICQNCIEK